MKQIRDYKDLITENILLQSEIMNHDRKNERVLGLVNLGVIIISLNVELKVLTIRYPGNPKLSEKEDNIRQLIDVYKQYASFYFDSLFYQKKSDKLEKENHDMGLRISELEAENEKMKQTLNFDNEV